MQTMSTTPPPSIVDVPKDAPVWGSSMEQHERQRGEVSLPSITLVDLPAAIAAHSCDSFRDQQWLLDQLHAQVLQGPLPGTDNADIPQQEASVEGVRLAEQIIRILPADALPQRVGITDDGEIIFGWGVPGEGAELSVERDGQIAAVLPLASGDCRVVDVEQASIEVSLPDEVMEACRGFSTTHGR